MSGDVGAEVCQACREGVPDYLAPCTCPADVGAEVADALAKHVRLAGGVCSCGATCYGRNYSREHRKHLGSVLAPLIAERVEAAKAEALREAADEHEAQLVCCDVFDRLKAKPSKDWTDAERREFTSHSICYWGAACAQGDRDRAASLDPVARMTTQTTLTLTDFLLARIAEDETAARAVAALVPSWTRGGETSAPTLADHIARHDPARVLAECEAKRLIVDALGNPAPKVNRGPRGMAERDGVEWTWTVAREGTLAALALPYADHPDYRAEWRP